MRAERPALASQNPASSHSYLEGEREDLPSLLNHSPYSSSKLLKSLKNKTSRTELLLPILPLPEVVLFPDETLPIRLPQTSPVAGYLQAAISLNARDYKAPVFIGILNSLRGGIESGSVGTIAEVASAVNSSDGSEYNDAAGENSDVMATLKGGRRYKVVRTLKMEEFFEGGGEEFIDYRRRFGAVDWCVVGLLGEEVPRKLGDVGEASRRHGLPKFLLKAADVHSKLDFLHDLCGGNNDSDSDADADDDTNNSPSKRSRLNSSPSSSTTIKSMLPACPRKGVEPLYFSFWIARNLPISTSERQKLLQAETIHQRVAAVMALLGLDSLSSANKKEDYSVKGRLYCTCGAPIAFKRDVFSVAGAAGCNNAYVNPHGVVHQTVTVRGVTNVVVEASLPTLRDTWFPGYAWTITYCKSCGDHLGWRFSLVTGSLFARPHEGGGGKLI